ncbi:MAG: YibE/F family protein, partial [Actinomycetota bacterium]
TAVLGTLASLGLTALLARLFVTAAQLTGFSTEEASILQLSAEQVNIQGLILGGIVIGSLGVLDDVTVTQASAVAELRVANPRYGFIDLYRSALRIGRDHIASTVNTLVLAYAGASLPLLILFTQASRNVGDVLTGEVVAVEIIRTLVGSIGLVASVPITTALAAWVLSPHHADEPAAG